MTQNQSQPLFAPLIGFGQVRHTRLHPQRNAFAYGTYFLMLPMRALTKSGSNVLAINRSFWLSFFDADHGDGRGPQTGGALAWVDELLQAEGITDATGEAWLHCYPRVLGYTFNPVSFWYCHTSAGDLRAIVVVVNNTFGERHVYLLDQPQLGPELRAKKVFHVSPFCAVEGGYRFRFMLNLQPTLMQASRTLVRIDYDDASGPLIETSVSGTLEPVTPQSIRKALWRYPVMTFGVMARIHWQALRLWLRKTHFFRKPEPPEALVSRQL